MRAIEIVLAGEGDGPWRRFESPRRVVAACVAGEVLPALRAVERWVELEGLEAVGFVAYEAAPAFDRALKVKQRVGSLPLLWFGLFEGSSAIEIPAASSPELVRLEWEPEVERAGYEAGIGRIQEHIRRGETYQVNYTFRLRASFDGDPWRLFVDLCEAQPSRYACFIRTDAFCVCSVSPELFFRLERGELVARPMKGTSPRGLTYAGDWAQAARLQGSPKNRAENVMIVDMTRNDIGKIAVPGSVAVETLYAVERYPTLWQMTSTVRGRTDAGIADVFRALFPCASITGAPKVKTMEIIRELEGSPRGIYTGAIGRIAPGRVAQFSVAIRTVVVDHPARIAVYGTGGGIVADSVGWDEYEEARLKARILLKRTPQFGLFESILWEPGVGYFLLAGHVRRLSQSAEYFGFRFNPSEFDRFLQGLAEGFGHRPVRVRVTLQISGQIDAESEPLPAAAPGKPVRVRLSPKPVDSSSVYLYHKTTLRAVYDQARQNCPGCDDVILWNERGEVTETTIANLVFDFAGRRVTPVVGAGLLAGVFRQTLLESGEVTEEPVPVAAIPHARRVYRVNSLRRWEQCSLEP